VYLILHILTVNGCVFKKDSVRISVYKFLSEKLIKILIKSIKFLIIIIIKQRVRKYSYNNNKFIYLFQ